MSDDFEKRLREKLDPLDAIASERTRSDNDLNPGFDNHPEQRPAAVLAPIIKRAGGWTLLFTARSVETPAHPGQISFPGGRVQASDANAVDTALRETFGTSAVSAMLTFSSSSTRSIALNAVTPPLR